MHEIIPGILEKEWAAIEQKIERVLPFAKSIHIDLIDGKYAQNTTFLDPKPFAKYAHAVTLELHMMVDNPIQYLEAFAQAGFKRFLGHVEMMPDQIAFVSKAQTFGEVGLALNGGTDPAAIRVPYQDLDTILVMSIKAGFSGQAYQSSQEAVMTYFHQHAHLPIEVDGGINDQTIQVAAQAGASRFVTTSFLFSGEPKIQFAKLDALLH
jgi:ribulose-phosphate 3-epimerase